MVVGSFSEDVTTSISPARVWKSILDSHNLLPKIAPEYIASVELVEGNGGPGSVVKLNFTQAVKELTHALNRIDVLDEATYTYKYTVIKGNPKYETKSLGMKLKAMANGGTLCKLSCEYKTAGDAVLSDEEIKEAKESNVKMFKAMDAYFLANPDAYL